MKKWICGALIVAMALCCWGIAETGSAPTAEVLEVLQTIRPATAQPEAAEPTPTPVPEKRARIGFEDGFSLEFPEGWLLHRIDEDMAAQGVLYCLSDADAGAFLYIQRWASDCADIESLKEIIDNSGHPQVSGIYNFNGTDFVVYDLLEGDVSCCAALLDGHVVNLVFSPQSDADFMVVAAQIIGSFSLLES